MARPVATDFLHSMRFTVDVTAADPAITLIPDGRPQAGFSAVTTPEATVEAVEYKEGTFVYTRKYPGNPTVSDLTFSRGVARLDATFWNWLRRVIEGTGDYRADLEIKHFHRDTALIREVPAVGTANLTNIDTSSIPAKTYAVHEAFPIRHKVAADLDATASEISVMELDCAYENFEVVQGAAP
jgi:phage tail-like protein